jgi:hypothetical protein
MGLNKYTQDYKAITFTLELSRTQVPMAYPTTSLIINILNYFSSNSEEVANPDSKK